MSSAVQAPPRPFLRSVRLERDAGQPDALRGYVLTPQVRGLLRRVLGGLESGGSERAFTLTGPYGSGKSAFALFLSELARDPHGPALALIEAVDPPLAQQVGHALPLALLPVPLTLRRVRLGLTLAEGLWTAAQQLPSAATPDGRRLIKQLAELREEAVGDTQPLLEGVTALQDRAVLDGYGGVLLVFDELGKALEHEARFEGADIYLLQELAETAARSGHRPLLFVGVLHQGFEQYGEHLLSSARKEWAKVQGRFADIAFLEPPEQQMRLAVQACAALTPAPSGELRELARQGAALLTELEQAPKGIEAEAFAALASGAAPLHSATLIALPYLFRRFAQNERSLFAYLLSGEPHAALQQWAADPTLIRLHDLFDYFSVNLLGSLSRQAFARRWLEVVDAVERHPDLTDLEVRTLKTVGLLGVLGEMSPLSSTAELVSVAMSDTLADPDVQKALYGLEHRSLVVFRRYNRTYRIWEGSDLEVEDRLEEGRRMVGANLALSEVLEKYLPRRLMVARRHSYDTGTFRSFEVRYLDAPVPLNTLSPASGADGLLLCALPSTPEQADAFTRWAADPALGDHPELLVTVPQGMQHLREAATELRALHWVREQTPELQGDRVARRELAERLVHIESLLLDATQHLIDPRPAPVGSGAQYWFLGELESSVHTPRQATQLLSGAMDELYPDSPRLLNELLNRRVLSSAAAAARRTLVELMLTRADEPLMGLEPGLFPPERSMYESALRDTGLHRPLDPEDEEGEWTLAAPDPSHSSNLDPTWQAMKAAIFGAEEPLNVEALFAMLAAPPYGVTAGLQPVLLSAFLSVYPHEISVYREGAFVPEPGIADFEVLMRRPELFAVMGSRISGERQKMVERLAKGYRTAPALVPVVRALIRGAKSLPDTSWRTRKLPPEVLKLRDAFSQARSPEQLLFVDLPAALGLPAIQEDSQGHSDAFFGALNRANTVWAVHATRQLAQAKTTLLTAFGFADNDDGWQAWQAQAAQLAERPLPATLIPLVQRLGAPGQLDAVQDGVLALVAGRSPRAWTDADAERFPAQARAAAQTYQIAAGQLGYATPEVEAQKAHYAEQLRTTLSPQRLRSSFADRSGLRLALLELLHELEDEEQAEEPEKM